jgi:L-alanine-DL-glutamate epimerase-like enolase superfamily enzyme
MNRRNFITGAGAFCSLGAISLGGLATIKGSELKKINISEALAEVDKEPLIKPFGFKGGYLTELWQSVVQLRSTTGSTSIGLGTQSVLWSDANLFSSHSETEGNSLMYAMTKKALQIIEGKSFVDPITLLDSIFDEVYHYGQKLTGKQDLRKTFALNALVSVDNAVWMLYAQENGITEFDRIIPIPYRPALSNHQNKLAYVPLVSYNVPVEELQKMTIDDGAFFIKVKLGIPGTQQEMVEKDKAHLTEIHKTVGSIKTPHTENGKLLYYFDANGRYESKNSVQQFLEHARKIGAFDQIAILEEPFPEQFETDVSDLGVRISADESAHTDLDVVKRIQMGYTAIALKPIAKTMSMSMKMVKTAYEHGIPCFCADLTVNPILVEWNKNVAARLSPFPGLKTGLLETNGAQNYKNWDTLCSYNSSNGASWTKIKQGVFELDEEYYRQSGGIFKKSIHYQNLFKS